MKRPPNAGFTLLELLTTVALAAVVIGIALPNFTAFARNNRLTGAANDILAAIYMARTEAIKQQQPVTMCFSSDPLATTPACDGNGTQGWITWIDLDGNSAVNTGEEVKVRHGAVHPSTVVVVKPTNALLISYGANGFARAVANTMTGVVLCDERRNTPLGSNSAARGVMIEPTGRPSVTKTYLTIKQSPLLLNNATSGTCVG